jgi:hypothetical protein
MKKLNIVFILFLFLGGCVATSSKVESPEIFVIGTYGSPPKFKGKVQYDTLISQLKDLRANTYNWLIMPNDSSFEQFKEFLPIAEKGNIDVWATLIPPVQLEAMGVGQYSTNDMIVWASELAALSIQYPNFKAWSIDDFTHSRELYTPKYVSEFQKAAKKINPDFKFYPVCYYQSIGLKFTLRYSSMIDGIVFPYRNESVERNLTDYSHLKDEINSLRSRFGSKFPIFVDVYSSPHSKLGEPSKDFISNVILSGIKNADGIIIFRHPNPRYNEEKYQIVKASIAKGLSEKK